MRGEEGGRGGGREGEVVRERSSERGGRGEGREEAEEKQRSSRREI